MADIRDCTPDDVPWIAECAALAYRGLVDGYDNKAAEAWVDACVRCPWMLTVRGDAVVGFASVGTSPWAPGVLDCDLVHLFGSGPEVVSVVSRLWDRARAAGCRRMFIGSIFADLSPIGRRLGGRALTTTYVLEVPDVQ